MGSVAPRYRVQGSCPIYQVQLSDKRASIRVMGMQACMSCIQVVLG